MKLLSAGVGAVVAVAVLLAATVAVTTTCLANPLACVQNAGGDAASGVSYDPAGGPITAADIDGISRAIGAPVPTYSVLRDPDAYGTGWGGPSINMIAPDMMIAVAQLEVATGQRLNVVSGYRTAGYQAQLCQRVAGPCAPPGRSMHQLGLAVDVTNWPTSLPHLDRVGLCQPLPTNDAGHLSHHTGREC